MIINPYRYGGGVPLPGNLVAYWEFEETTAVDRVDSHGSNDATIHNGVASTASGKVGNASLFSPSAHCKVSDNADVSVGDIPFEWSGWVYPTDLGTTRVIVSQNQPTDSSDPKIAYALGYNSASNRFRFAMGDGGSNSAAVLADNLGAPSTATWYHLSAWHDPTADTINIQANNGTIDSQAYSSGGYDSDGPLVIGALIDTGSVFVPWFGRIDELSLIKNYIPTAADRTWRYNSGNGRSYSEWLSYSP